MRKFLLLMLMATFMTGCNVFEGDDDGPAPEPGPDPDPPPVENVDFTGFVLDLVQNQTADNTAPVEINDIDFDFADDPAAFDELFDTSP